jgi:type IV pilus assembly protein PilE
MPKHPARAHHSRASGFTLIEVMIAIAILAILGAVAFPSFMDSIRKGRRADAFAAVSAVQLAQERWRANHQLYSKLVATDLKVTEPDLYTITVDDPPTGTLSSGYVVTAVGKGSQANDKQCKKMSMKLLNGNLSYAGCFDCTSFTYSTTHACWAR